MQEPIGIHRIMTMDNTSLATGTETMAALTTTTTGITIEIGTITVTTIGIMTGTTIGITTTIGSRKLDTSAASC